MCDRKCPKCGSNAHYEQYGLSGTYIACEDCHTILANRRDEAAARTDLTEDEVEAWVRAGTFVLPGAQAVDATHDALFRLWGVVEVISWSGSWATAFV